MIDQHCHENAISRCGFQFVIYLQPRDEIFQVQTLKDQLSNLPVRNAIVFRLPASAQ